MSNGEGFLRAVIEEPDNDGLRLVYADWLEEHGAQANPAASPAERAEIIRLQCELARLPARDPRASACEARAVRLLAKHAHLWRDKDLGYCRFRRGFVEELFWWNPWQVVEKAEEVFARHPIRDVEVNGQPEDGWGPALAKRPELARVETLRLTHSRSGWLQFRDVLAVLRSPHLARLTALDFSGGDGGHRYGDDRFLDLIRLRRGKLLPGLRNLRRLSLNGLALSDRSLLALLDSPVCASLTHLDLSDNGGRQGIGGITAAGIRALVNSPLWGRLEELNLGSLYLEDDEAVLLVAAALPYSRITRLGLGAVLAHDAGPEEVIAALDEVPSWGRLRELNLSWNRFQAEDVRQLVAQPGLAQLTRLDFAGDSLDDEGVALLAACPALTGLSSLKIENFSGRTSGAALEALASSRHLSGLVSLHLDSAGVSDEAVAAFATSPNVARLRLWHLPSSVTDRGLEAIAGSPHCGSLTTLLFGHIHYGGGPYVTITEEGVRALVESVNLPHLAVFDRNSFQLTPEARAVLARSERIACLSYTDRVPGKLSTLDLFEFHHDPFFPWSKHAYA